MVIDTSALVAMLTDQPDAEHLEGCIADDPVRMMSTASYLETVRAGPNYGDCFSYALAKVSGQPLLFKGDEFEKTDIVAAQ